MSKNVAILCAQSESTIFLGSTQNIEAIKYENGGCDILWLLFVGDLKTVITSQGRKNLVVIKNKRGYLGILGIFDNLINYVRKSKILVFFLEILPFPNMFCLFFGTEFIKSDTGIMVTPSPIQNQGEFKEKVTRG